MVFFSYSSGLGLEEFVNILVNLLDILERIIWSE